MKETDTHIYFLGSEFSNWYMCNFTYKDYTFHNSEQAFMWEKANTFKDKESAELILKTPKPNENKQLGRKVKNFDSFVWANVSYDIMRDVNFEKFSQNADLKEFILSTGDKIIVEASPTDLIWGVGLDCDDPKILDEKNWKGKNLLGKVLMEVRAMLRDIELSK